MRLREELESVKQESEVSKHEWLRTEVSLRKELNEARQQVSTQLLDLKQYTKDIAQMET